MPLQRRLPKRGFTNIFKRQYAIVNLRDLGRFEKDALVDERTLVEVGLVKGRRQGVKLLGHGSIAHPLVVKVNRCSKSAREGVERAGGRVELV
jgi:large subunit ribosomal protein L15